MALMGYGRRCRTTKNPNPPTESASTTARSTQSPVEPPVSDESGSAATGDAADPGEVTLGVWGPGATVAGGRVVSAGRGVGDALVGGGRV